MNTRNAKLVALLVSCGLPVLAGCKNETAKAAPPPPPTVTVAQPIVREVIDYDEYTGRMDAVEQVEVRARVKGYLQSIGFKDGDDVKKGQVLFQIDPRPFEATYKTAQGQVDQLKARRIKNDADVKRYQDLVPKGAASQQDLDRAIGELGETVAGISSALAEVERARLDLEYAKVTAPIDGMASRAQFTVGNLIGASGGGEQLLTTIVRINPIYLYFDIDQRAVQAYRKAAVARSGATTPLPSVREMGIKFQFGLASETGFPHEGVIDFIDNKVDATTGTISIRGEVKNEQEVFKPGFFARVRVAAADKYKAVLVSDRAVGTQQGQKYVMVIDDKNTVVFRPVTLGAAQEGGLRVVRSGLAAGERVVVNGLQRARPGLPVKAEPGEMMVSPATRPMAMRPVEVR
jgi:RND family efflux transporter MFP subunit